MPNNHYYGDDDVYVLSILVYLIVEDEYENENSKNKSEIFYDICILVLVFWHGFLLIFI